MGIYVNYWLSYIIVVDINDDNIDDAINIIKSMPYNISVKSDGNIQYIEIAKCDNDRLTKTEYYKLNMADQSKIIYETLLKKINTDEIIELLHNEQEMLTYLLNSDLKKYIISHDWYAQYDCWTIYDDLPRKRLYKFLQYNIIVNIDDNPDNINNFKNKLKSICGNCDPLSSLNLFRQKDNNVKFIKLVECTGNRLENTPYYKHIEPVWNIYKVGRRKIKNDIVADLTEKESVMLQHILNSELKNNIISHGWYYICDE